MNLNRLKKDEILWLYNHYCKAHYHRFTEHINCFLREKPTMSPLYEKIGFLDIECSNLKADFGIVFSYCIKEEGGKIYERVITSDEIRKKIYDKNVLKQCCEDMRRFDKIAVYYGLDRRFDLPTLRTRSLYWGLNFPLYKEIKGVDLYPVVRNKLNLHRNRLETACDFFGIVAKEHKLKPDIWFRAMAGNKSALNYILKHNREDVISLELLYEKLKDFMAKSNTSI